MNPTIIATLPRVHSINGVSLTTSRGSCIWISPVSLTFPNRETSLWTQHSPRGQRAAPVLEARRVAKGRRAPHA